MPTCPDSVWEGWAIYYVTHDANGIDDPSAWGWEIPISSSGTFGARYPSIALDSSDGSIHVVWTEYDSTRGTTDVVYCEGEPIDATITSNATWDHHVFLDETVTIASGATVTVDTSTVVYAQTPEDITSDPLVGLVVQGQLVAEGTEQAPILFTSTKDSTTAEWTGIRFASGSGGVLEHVTVENALIPVTLDDAIPDLVSVTLDSSSVSAVAVVSDLTVPQGTTWELTGPLTLSVADTADGTGGVDDALVEIIVNGTLSLDGTAGALGFEAEADSAGSWYGFWLASDDAISWSGPVAVEDALAGVSVPDPNDDDAFLAAVRNLTTGLAFDDVVDDVVYVAPPGQVTTWNSALWDGNKVLPVDFLIAREGTLQVAPGTVVTVESGEGLEIRADGPLFALGNGRPDSVVTFTSTEQTSGDWQGIRFLDGSDIDAVSRLDYVDIEYPVIGAQLDSLSGNLFDPKFTEVETHTIFLDRDTRVAEGSEWNLTAPCTVTAANSDASSAGEDPARVEIVVSGKLKTQAGGSGQYVVFEPVTKDSLDGDDWGGITIRGTGFHGYVGVAELDSVEISHATYPLSFVLADQPYVKNSLIHHYRDEAITDFGSDATIAGNKIWRGTGMRPPPTLVGRIGVHLLSTAATCEDNQVFHQMQKGIWADFSSSWCTSPASTPPTAVLRVRRNHVVGNRVNFEGLASQGIEVSWACRQWTVGIDSNNVHGWPENGIKIRQSSDVYVGSSCVQDNETGILHRRDKLDYDATENGYSRLQNNLLMQNEVDNVRTYKVGPEEEPNSDDPNTGGLFGGGISGAGGNVFQVLAQNGNNWHLDSTDSLEAPRKDFANENGWRNHLGTALAAADSVQEYNEWFFREIQGGIQEIVIADFDPAAEDPQSAVACTTLTDPSGTAPSMRHRLAGHELAEGEGEEATGIEEVVELPRVLAFHAPRPNPARSGVVMQLDVPVADAGWVEVKVYDVTGRRVKTVLSGVVPAGRHPLRWDFTNEHGRRVVSGIYFARMEIREKRVVHRIVVLK